MADATVDPEQALATLEQLRAAAAAVRTELAPKPGFQTSEGQLTALRQGAYAILAVLGLFGVHAGTATASIDRWLPIAAFAAALVDGAIYTWRRSGLKAAVAASVAALVTVPPAVPIGPPVVDGPTIPTDPGIATDGFPPTNASGAADLDPGPAPPTRPSPTTSVHRARTTRAKGRRG